MQAAIERVVCFEDKSMAEVSLNADVGLVTLRDAQCGIQATGEIRFENAVFSDERRINGERLRKLKVF